MAKLKEEQLRAAWLLRDVEYGNKEIGLKQKWLEKVSQQEIVADNSKSVTWIVRRRPARRRGRASMSTILAPPQCAVSAATLPTLASKLQLYYRRACAVCGSRCETHL